MARKLVQPGKRQIRRIREAPLTTVAPAECAAMPSAERVECSKCNKTFAGGAVVTHPPTFSATRNLYVVTRVIYCDHCDHLQVWDEASDQDGNPLGMVLSAEPTHIKRHKDIAWALKHFPELKGVQQS